MFGKFEQPIQINLRISYRLSLLVHIAHAGALVCLFLLDIPAFVKVLIALLILISFAHIRKQHLLKEMIHAPVWLLLTGTDEWWLKFADGRIEITSLMPGSYVHPWLIIIPLRVRGKVHRILITSDGVDDPESLRRLRVRLIHPLKHEHNP